MHTRKREPSACERPKTEQATVAQTSVICCPQTILFSKPYRMKLLVLLFGCGLLRAEGRIAGARHLVPQHADATAIAISISKARADLSNLIQKDNTLVPQILRLGFHDCIDVCDGKRKEQAQHHSSLTDWYLNQLSLGLNCERMLGFAEP